MLAPARLTLDNLHDTSKLFRSGAGYHQYSLPKRNGGLRTISAPTSECSNVLKGLRLAMEHAQIYSPPDAVHGFVSGRGIFTNASQHLGRDVVLSIDLVDFFPSVGLQTIVGALVQAGLDSAGARAIGEATTINGVLPVGFNTSPLLSNMVFSETDLAIAEYAQKVGVTYSRYADDLTFSGMFGDEVLAGVTQVLADANWQLNERKTRFMRRGGPQYVTGLYVGDYARPHVPRRIKRRLRQRLHYLSKFGFDDVAEHSWNDAMSWDAASGWVSYVHQVEPEIAQVLAETLEKIDFGDPPPRWGNPEDWSLILDEFVPF